MNPVSRAIRLARLLNRLHELDKLDRVLEAVGRIEARQLDSAGPLELREREFTVYSQHGEDGILHWLVHAVAIPNRLFVEFGVGNYREANTRFLATNDHWAGLVMDGDPDNVRRIQTDPAFWRINVRAVAAFVTRDNINDLLRAHRVTGEIGLLSIDIDGNDYWVFEAIDVVSPAVVAIEYNSRFGPDRAVTVPYNPDFDRWRAHPSGLYAGASLRAIVNLAHRKGYAFVGCNSFGVNAFFVRNDLVNAKVTVRSVEEGYVAGGFRESRDRRGRLTLLDSDEEQRILAGLPLVTLDEEGRPSKAFSDAGTA